MPATVVRQTSPVTRPAAPSFAVSQTGEHIFEALQSLHGIPRAQTELLGRAAAGLGFIRSTDTYTLVEHKLFRIALAELSARDAFVVEAAACCAADVVPFGDRGGDGPEPRADKLRALWFAAILRISDALCPAGDLPPTDVFATWTSEFVYLEFDGDEVSGRRLERARSRVAALEALTGRTVVVASSAARRGAA